MDNTHKTAVDEPSIVTTGGYCRRCNREHRLGPGNTRQHCRELMRRFDDLQTIDRTFDLSAPQAKTHAKLGTAPLFGPARGKMFGVLECLRPNGTTIILYAFSGQYHGSWLVDGWVPPLFDIDDFLSLTVEKEQQIKELGRTIEQRMPHSGDWLAQRKKRRQLSQNLMCEIHNLYSLSNFRGETAGLTAAFTGSKGIPTGTGDCCAPKLLNFAAKNNLRPLGIHEFFWGRENRAGGHRHGAFTSSCAEKCQPILGFMLCGLDERAETIK